MQSRNYTSTELILRLLREHILPHKRHLATAVVCMFIVAIATAANAWMLQPVLDKIFIERDREMLTLIPVAVLTIALFGAVGNYGNTLNMRYIGQRIIADMQIRLFNHLVHSDLGLFHDQSSGRLISRFTNDIALLRNAFSTVLTGIAKEMLSLVFLVGVMIYQSPTLSAIAFLAFPLAIYPIIRLGKRMRKVSDKTQMQLGDFTSTLDEIFQGVRTVKSYNREKFESERAGGIIEGLFKLYYKAIRIQAAASPLMELLSSASIAGVIWYGGFQVMDGETTTGAFFSSIAAFLMAYKPVRSVAGLNSTLQEGLAAASRLFSVLDTQATIIDRPGCQPLVISKGHIAFNHVTFHYNDSGIGIHDVSFEVPAGKTAALVGLSGSGKSTLMNLLLRFYDINSGNIRIDGQDIHESTLHSLRDAMSFVPQESMLFDDTIRANIRYGRETATDEEIFEAARNAAADDFIRQLPEGYDTMIGAHGVRLSGGQRQRLAIARAMLKNAPILLLDEATSSLDNESERSIQQALKILMEGRTTLVIAHRLSTIVNADIIHVVENGRIIESGTHQQLMAKQSKYYHLYAETLHHEVDHERVI
jgi:subfamily B ATP-binding cassette protein MsbA